MAVDITQEAMKEMFGIVEIVPNEQDNKDIEIQTSKPKKNINILDVVNFIISEKIGDIFGSLYADVSFQNTEKIPEIAKNLEKALEYTSNYKKRHVVMFGTKGTGKTHIAVCIARQIVYNMFTSYKDYKKIIGFDKEITGIVKARIKDIFNNFFDKIGYTTLINMRIEYGHNFEKMEDSIEAYKGYKLLIIDEIDKENMSDFFKSLLHTLLDYRYRNELSTVLISNAGKNDVEKKIYDATLDRFIGGNNLNLFFEYASYRQKNKKRS
jgi:DNA replication protein DnaC